MVWRVKDGVFEKNAGISKGNDLLRLINYGGSMSIWFNKSLTLDDINRICQDTAVSHLDIEFIEIGDDFLIAKLPVSNKAVQPLRMLHGGISCVLAETVGSAGSNLIVDHKFQYGVGQSLNASHIRSALEGETVYCKSSLIHSGKTSHIWESSILNEKDKLLAKINLTVAIREKT